MRKRSKERKAKKATKESEGQEARLAQKERKVIVGLEVSAGLKVSQALQGLAQLFNRRAVMVKLYKAHKGSRGRKVSKVYKGQ
jgi:hypothetical protein